MAQIVNIVRELFNLRFDKQPELTEEELAIIQKALGMDPLLLKNDTRDLVEWWEAGIIPNICKIMGVTLK